MNGFRRLVTEAHRRSLWQVFTVYLAVAWMVIQVVDSLMDMAGLPDWVGPFTLVLLLVGLPVVLATAFVQEGLARPGEPGWAGSAKTRDDVPGMPPASKGAHRALFTWRNAVAGGVGAFAVLGVAVTGYFGMRVTGVGPVASLAAQGVFEEREPVVLADFAHAGGQDLGRMVTEALRVDLVESPAISVVPPAFAQEGLARMGREGDAALTPDLARELAVRGGIKAVLQGDVGVVGSGYVLTASLVDAATGDVLAAFRETAGSDDELLGAIDQLSQRIREKAGESLRSIRAGVPLEEVTTGSLDALREYTQAIRLADRGDEFGALALLESAVEQDPGFAMAWRKMAVIQSNLQMDPARVAAAATQAYELRDRLGARERGLAEGYYFTAADPDASRAMAAYERVLERWPDDGVALNNLALQYAQAGRHDEALALTERTVALPAPSSVNYTNAVYGLWVARRDAEALHYLEEMGARFPGTTHLTVAVDLALARRDWARAHELAERLAASPEGSFDRVFGPLYAATADVALGRLDEARRHARAALAAARQGGEPGWLGFVYLWNTGMEWSLGSGEAARAWLDAAVEEVPPGAGLDVAWAQMAGLLGDGARARRHLEAASTTPGVALAPQRRERALAEAYGAIAEDRFEEALDALERAANAVPCPEAHRCGTHFERGLVLEGLGRFDEAAVAYVAHADGTPPATHLFPPLLHPLALEGLARSREALGDTAAAVEAWRAVASYWAEPDAELLPRIRHAEARSAALGGGS